MAFRWYIVHVHSGFEKKVVHSIQEQAGRKGLDEHLGEFLVPSEDVIEIRHGRKVNSERKIFPGYVLVQADMNDELFLLVRHTPKVTGFLGSGGRPVPISDAEAQRIRNTVQESIERPRSLVSFDVGEMVRVSDGPFNSFNAVVEDVDRERSRLRVSVTIFGRHTPVELEYSQVEKLQ